MFSSSRKKSVTSSQHTTKLLRKPSSVYDDEFTTSAGRGADPRDSITISPPQTNPGLTNEGTPMNGPFIVSSMATAGTSQSAAGMYHNGAGAGNSSYPTPGSPGNSSVRSFRNLNTNNLNSRNGAPSSIRNGSETASIRSRSPYDPINSRDSMYSFHSTSEASAAQYSASSSNTSFSQQTSPKIEPHRSNTMSSKLSNSSNATTSTRNLPQPQPQPPPSNYASSSRSHKSISNPTRNSIESIVRPPDEFVRQRFAELQASCGLPTLPAEMLTDYTKQWAIIQSADSQSKKGWNGGPSDMKHQPEYYVQLMREKSMGWKEMEALGVSLRSMPINWVEQFRKLNGLSALSADVLATMNPKDIALESEAIKCFRILVNRPTCLQEIFRRPDIIANIAKSIVSESIATRKSTAEILMGLCHSGQEDVQAAIIRGLDSIRDSRIIKGRFAVWLTVFGETLDGRGRMGSAVGASAELRENKDPETLLLDYADTNVLLINALIDNVHDLNQRIHFRNELEDSGLTSILLKLKKLVQTKRHSKLVDRLKRYDIDAEQDTTSLMQNYKDTMLHSLTDPGEIFRAIYESVRGTAAERYFLSEMKAHLLIDRDLGKEEERVRVFRVLSEVANSVVVDRKTPCESDTGISLGIAVNKVMAKYQEADKYEKLKEMYENSKTESDKFRRRLLDANNRVREAEDALNVGAHHVQLAKKDDDLKLAHLARETIQSKYDSLKSSSQTRIAELEEQIRFLFSLLADGTIPMSGSPQESQLPISLLHEQLATRKSAVWSNGSALESIVLAPDIKFPKATGQLVPNSSFSDNSPVNSVEDDSQAVARPKRISQFDDASDDTAQQHFENSLATGVAQTFSVGEERDARNPSPRTLRPGALNNVTSRSPSSSLSSRKSSFNPSYSNDVRSRSSNEQPSTPTPLSNTTLPIVSPTKDTSSLVRKESDSRPKPNTSGLAAMLQARIAKGLTGPPSSALPSTATKSESEPEIFVRPQMLPFLAGIKALKPKTDEANSEEILDSGDITQQSFPLKNDAQSTSASISNLTAPRKDVALVASQKIKQLQWDKIPANISQTTVWGSENVPQESEWISRLRSEGVWIELEEDFAFKKVAEKIIKDKENADVISILDPTSQRNVEIVLGRTKHLTPEEVADKIVTFDEGFCSQSFLSELKSLLPSADQIGKLVMYKEATSEVLMKLHPADRLMVQLVKIHRLRERIEGMLYKEQFEDLYETLIAATESLQNGSQALQKGNAPHFTELLKLILLIGNFMNATGTKGGAFGFKITSLNKLVDTKDSKGLTLLHFLERTAAKSFSDMDEGFLLEMENVVIAAKVDNRETRRSLKILRDGWTSVNAELAKNFGPEVNLPASDGYLSKMSKFMSEASQKLESLNDSFTMAESLFEKTLDFYGEVDHNLRSDEFFGIFRQFVASYRKSKFDNQSAAEAKAAADRRKAAHDTRMALIAQRSPVIEDGNGDFDKLLEKLRSTGSGSFGRRSRRDKNRIPTLRRTAEAFETVEQDSEKLSLPHSDSMLTLGAAAKMLAKLRGSETVESTSSPQSYRRTSKTNAIQEESWPELDVNFDSGTHEEFGSHISETPDRIASQDSDSSEDSADQTLTANSLKTRSVDSQVAGFGGNHENESDEDNSEDSGMSQPLVIPSFSMDF